MVVFADQFDGDFMFFDFIDDVDRSLNCVGDSNEKTLIGCGLGSGSKKEDVIKFELRFDVRSNG